MKTLLILLNLAVCSALSATDMNIVFDPAPPRGLPPEVQPRPASTNAPKRLADLGQIARVQIRFFDTNAFTSTTVSNYVVNLVEMNPEVQGGIFWADPQVTPPMVEAYVTFNGPWHGGPSRWLIWPQRSIIWAPWPAHRWMFFAWMDDGRLRNMKKE